MFYPVVIFFSYLGSISVCLLRARARLVRYKKEYLLLSWEEGEGETFPPTFATLSGLWKL